MEFCSIKPRFSASSSSSTSLNNSQSTTTTIHHINFNGITIETTVTSNEPTITQWLTNISSSHINDKELIVGLDIEWKPNRTKYMNNKAATLQLCIGTKCIVIQLLHLGSIPQSLTDFLWLTPNVTFVGVEVANDVAKLTRDYGLRCLKTQDLRDAVSNAGGSGPKPGLKKLAWQVVGLVMNKPKYVTLSNWEKRVLSEEQVQYACIDAYASYRIGHKLLIEG